jgi:hypothetical protein
MAERNFSLLSESEPKGLQPTYPGQDNDSAGFMFPYKVASGTMRGTQDIGTGGVKIDSAHNRIEVSANNAKLLLGDGSDQDNTTGFTFFDSTNTRRMLFGTYPDGSVKAKLSQPNKDVATATDDELIWSSDFNLFKIVDIVTVPLSVTIDPVNAKLASFSTPHGLTFTPAYVAFITIDPAFAALSSVGTTNGPNPFMIVGTSGADVAFFGVFEVTVDATNINFAASIGVTGTGTYSFSAKVYLLRETII